jgi:hypothetical protein
VRLRSLRRGRLPRRLGHWQNLDTADFLADVAHGKSVGTRSGIGASSAVPTRNCDRGTGWRGGRSSRQDQVDRVLGQLLVGGHDGDRQFLSLRDDQPIEGVVVVIGQLGDPKGVRVLDRQRRHSGVLVG